MKFQELKVEEKMVMDIDELVELRLRNEQRAKLAKEALGTKWLLHPNNSVKIKKHKSVLTKKK